MLAVLAPGAIWAQMSTIGVPGIDRVADLGADRAPGRDPARTAVKAFVAIDGGRALQPDGTNSGSLTDGNRSTGGIARPSLKWGSRHNARRSPCFAEHNVRFRSADHLRLPAAGAPDAGAVVHGAHPARVLRDRVPLDGSV